MAQDKICVFSVGNKHFCRFVFCDKRNARDEVDVEGIRSVSGDDSGEVFGLEKFNFLARTQSFVIEI
jgi:hypothetical protein